MCINQDLILVHKSANAFLVEFNARVIHSMENILGQATLHDISSTS